MERDRGACNRPQTRFAFDAESMVCVPFLYAGCGGNFNNFETETACNRFCTGVGVDPASGEMGDDSPTDVFSLGFTLSGPLRRAKHTGDFTERVRDYLLAAFNLEDDSIRDLYVRDDNSVRFNLVHADAQRKAADISNAACRWHL